MIEKIKCKLSREIQLENEQLIWKKGSYSWRTGCLRIVQSIPPVYWSADLKRQSYQTYFITYVVIQIVVCTVYYTCENRVLQFWNIGITTIKSDHIFIADLYLSSIGKSVKACTILMKNILSGVHALMKDNPDQP